MASSLVSFARKEIFEEVPGMQYAHYRVGESNGKIPTILHVGNSHYYKPDIDGVNDMVMVPSADIVHSIVRMHNTSQLGYSPTTHPAFFAISDEEVNKEILMEKYATECEIALKHQRNWYAVLVRMADDDWQTLQRHNMVSSIQRIAARELGLNREWLLQVEEETGIPGCPFCGKNLISASAPVCPTCGRVINAKKLAEIEALIANSEAKKVKV